MILVNPQHRKAVPGRKTDAKESEWLADFLRHGLLRASFIPPKPIRELRELMRYRKTLVQERARGASIGSRKPWRQRISNLPRLPPISWGKVDEICSRAMIQGTTDAEVLSELARGTRRRENPPLTPGARWSSTAASPDDATLHSGPYRLPGRNVRTVATRH